MTAKYYRYARYAVATLIALCASLAAEAFKVDFNWNLPGAAEIKISSYLTGDVVGPASDADTSFSYECENSKWVYLVAKEGYKISSAEINGTPATPSVVNGMIYVGKFFTAPSAVNVTLTPVERESEITIDVENGAAWVDALFNDGYSVTLDNGVNTVKYDPDLEKSLSLTPCNGVSEFYSITLNGVALKKKYAWSTSYEVETLNPGDKVVIRVFEDKEPVLTECKVSVVLADGMTDCIRSIRDWTASEWLTLDADGCLTVNGGTDLQFNFNVEDYNITSLSLNGRDVTSDLNDNRLRFIVEEDTELKVEGAPKRFANVDYTAYVTNPEGVILYLGIYEENEADLSGGTVIEAPITLPATNMTGEVVMDVENTRSFSLPVSEKNPYIYVAPREGWYIYTVQGLTVEEEGKEPVLGDIATVTPESKDFYVVARRFEGMRTMAVNVIGDAAVRLSGSSAKSTLWNNPVIDYDIHEGEQQIEFLPGYNLPMTVRTLEQLDNFGAFLDGAMLTADDNNSYSFTPWYPEDGAEQNVESTLTVYATGTAAPMGRVKLELADEVEGTLLYSAVRHEANAKGQVLLAGTEVTVKPALADVTIKIDDVVVNGIGPDGKMVFGLDENNEYVFESKEGTTVVALSKGSGIVGVEGVDASAEDCGAIYSIDGRRSRVDDPALLAPGLYIIAGKKVLVK